MNKLLLSILIIILHAGGSYAQVLPKQDSKLNYRLIGFSFPTEKVRGSFTVEIAAGRYISADSFSRHIIQSVETKSGKVVAEVPAFGKEYTWRFTSATKGPGKLYHFSTLNGPSADTSKVRLRILKKAERYEDGYVFLDGNAVLYDMKGNPVWFLPNNFETVKSNEHSEHDGHNHGGHSHAAGGIKDLRDMKITSRGTITFINDDMPYEISYSGEILWKGTDTGYVSKDNEEHYHHEVNRLSNGHYMVLGDEFAQSKLFSDSSGKNGGGYIPLKMTKFGTVIEYDEKGKVVWSWKSSGHYKDKQLYNTRKPNGVTENTIHENSFYFDEKNKMLYVGFKHISQILKIKYPEGKIVAVYGNVYKKGDETSSLFCEQHSCKLTKDGYLLVYNNNMCNWEETPKIVMLKEPDDKNKQMTKVWEYETTQEVTSILAPEKPYKTMGGNALELPDESLFISMCTPYANVFILDKDKQIKWNAVPEKWDGGAKKWIAIPQYRGSIITDRKKMEQLIWGQ